MYNHKRFRLRNLQPIVQHEKQHNNKRNKLVGILTDVIKNILSSTDDENQNVSSIGLLKSQIIKTQYNHSIHPEKINSQQKIEQIHQITISNHVQIENQNGRSLFRQHLDVRDYVLTHPFSFTLKIPENLNKQKSQQPSKQQNSDQSQPSKILFIETQEFQQICERMDDFIVSVCQNIFSIGFNFLNNQKLLQNQSKDFASKNILLNVKSAISSIVEAVKKYNLADDKKQLQEIKYYLTQRADQTLLQVLKNLADYYPQAPPTGGTPKMRAALASVNRMDDNQFDLIFAHDIRVTKKEIETHDYTQFIMKVLNKAIQVTGQIEDSDIRGRTLFQKFTEFCQNLFGITQRKQNYFIKYLNKITFSQEKLTKEKEIALYLQNIVLGNDKVQNTQRPTLQQVSLQHEQYRSKILQNTIQEVDRLKKNRSFGIGQKIPSFVKSFSNNDLKQKNISAKNSSILRILTKWAEYLQQIFDNPDIIIKQRIYPFKTTENQPINAYKHIKDSLYNNLINCKDDVKAELSKFQSDNTVFQAQFLSKSSNETINSFVKRFSDTRETASKMNAVLIKYMLKYINILIDNLINAGKEIYIDFQEKTVNLVSFRIGDLMRARLQCNQLGFINILKSLYALDELNNHNFFKLVRIKNKLDSKDNNVLINFMFMGKTQCELQLSIQNLGGKQKNYYSFSHFIYELTRGKFGVLTECAIIISQHDPQVSSNKGIFYKPKRKSKPQKVKKQQSQTKGQNEQNTLLDANDKKMFVCSGCGQLIFNQNIDLIKRKGPEAQFLYVCMNCALKDAKSKNLTNQQMISDETTSCFLKKWVEKQVLIKLQKFDLQYCHTLLSHREVFLLRFDPLSTQLQLSCIWQYQNKSTYYLLKLTSQIPNMTSDQKIKELVEYKDISKQVLNKAPTDKFTYIVWNFMDKQFRNQLYPILKITHECISNNKIFQYFLKQQCKAKVLENFSSKNQILNVFEDKTEIAEVQKYFQTKTTEQINDKKHYISRVYANYLALKTTPNFLESWRNLKVLSLSDNHLQQINLTQKVQLIELYLSKNSIKEIDLSNNSKLQIIYIGDNKLTKINVDNMPQLKVLSLSSNTIGSLDLTKNPNLRELNMIDNRLKEINLQSNPHLTILYLASNDLKTLNLQNNLKIAKLNMYHNSIQNYDLKNKPDLFWLRLSQNSISQIDLSYNKKLVYLDLSNNNKLEKLNLQNLSCLQNAEMRVADKAQISDVLLDGVNPKCKVNVSCSYGLKAQLRQKYKHLKIV